MFGVTDCISIYIDNLFIDAKLYSFLLFFVIISNKETIKTNLILLAVHCCLCCCVVYVQRAVFKEVEGRVCTHVRHTAT